MSCDYCIGDVQYGKASGDDAEVRCSLDLPSLLQTDGSLHEFSFYFLYCTDYFNLRIKLSEFSKTPGSNWLLKTMKNYGLLWF